MLLFVALAHASVPSLAAPALPVDDAAEHTRLMAAVDASTDQPCLTELVAELRQHWTHLTVAERAHASAVLAPNGRDLFAPVTPKWTGAAPPPAKDSCWSEYDNRIAGDHFVVEWQDGVDEADAEQFLSDLEYSWGVEVDTLGWDAADGSDKYLILAEIENKRTGGAYTTVQSCGGQYIPYIVSGKDSWDDPDWGASMAPHEFNHALQFGYSYAPEFWWWEATATYMEDNVYPDINYWAPYVAGYTDNPYIALSASSQSDYDIFNHMYGLAILGFYLDNYQGGPDTVLQTWQDAKRDRGQYNKSFPDMVDDLGLDWPTVYADFVARNTVMDYDQQRYFPAIDLHDTIRALPAEGKSKSADTPQGYGQNYVLFNAGMGEGDLVVHFSGATNVDWLAELVEVKAKRVERVVQGELVDGVGDVTLTGYGGNDVYLVVSPLTESDADYKYSWTAELVATAPVDTGGDTAANPDDSGNGNGTGDSGLDDGDGALTPGDNLDISTPGGCGCDSGGVGRSLGVGLVLAGLAAGRRRK